MKYNLLFVCAAIVLLFSLQSVAAEEITKNSLTVYAVDNFNQKANIIDGSTSTIWQPGPNVQENIVAFKRTDDASFMVNAATWYGQNAASTYWVCDYTFEASNDSTDGTDGSWSVLSNVTGNTNQNSTTTFSNTTAKFVRFKTSKWPCSGAGGANGISLAEVYLYGENPVFQNQTGFLQGISVYLKFDELNGTVAVNEVGSNATLAGSVVRIDGVHRGAVNFTTSSSYVQLDATYTPNSTSFWVNHVAGDDNTILYGGSNDVLNIQGNGNLLIYDGSVRTPSPAANVGNGTWTHVVLVYDGSGYSIYINGTNVSYVTSSKLDVQTIGRSLSGSISSVDEFGAWSRSLNSTEVSSLYAAGAALTYPFGERPSFDFPTYVVSLKNGVVNDLTNASITYDTVDFVPANITDVSGNVYYDAPFYTEGLEIPGIAYSQNVSVCTIVKPKAPANNGIYDFFTYSTTGYVVHLHHFDSVANSIMDMHVYDGDNSRAHVYADYNYTSKSYVICGSAGNGVAPMIWVYDGSEIKYNTSSVNGWQAHSCATNGSCRLWGPDYQVSNIEGPNAYVSQGRVWANYTLTLSDVQKFIEEVAPDGLDVVGEQGVDTTGFDGSTTNFSAVNTSAVDYPVLEKVGSVKIEWNGQDLNFSSANLTQYVTYGEGWVDVASQSLPVGVNTSANVTLYHTAGLYSNPQILVDGSPCGSCSIISYNATQTKFSVPHFTNYSVSNGTVSLGIELLSPANGTTQINSKSTFRVGLTGNGTADSVCVNVSGDVRCQTNVTSPANVSFTVVNLTYGTSMWDATVTLGMFTNTTAQWQITYQNTTQSLSYGLSLEADADWKGLSFCEGVDCTTSTIYRNATQGQEVSVEIVPNDTSYYPVNSTFVVGAERTMHITDDDSNGVGGRDTNIYVSPLRRTYFGLSPLVSADAFGQAGRLMDQSTFQAWQSGGADGQTPYFGGYRADLAPFVVDAITFVNWDLTDVYHVDDYLVQASDDNSTWVTLANVTGRGTSGVRQEYVSFENNEAYVYYRVQVTKWGNGTTHTNGVLVRELYLHREREMGDDGFIEEFDSSIGFTSRASGVVSYSSPSANVTTEQIYAGNGSLKFLSGERYFNISSPLGKKLTAYVYDGNYTTGPYIVGSTGYQAVGFGYTGPPDGCGFNCPGRFIGIVMQNGQANYSVTYANYPYSGVYVFTNKSRSVGWHKFEIEFLENGSLTFEVDDQVVRTAHIKSYVSPMYGQISQYGNNTLFDRLTVSNWLTNQSLYVDRMKLESVHGYKTQKVKTLDVDVGVATQETTNLAAFADTSSPAGGDGCFIGFSYTPFVNQTIDEIKFNATYLSTYGVRPDYYLVYRDPSRLSQNTAAGGNNFSWSISGTHVGQLPVGDLIERADTRVTNHTFTPTTKFEANMTYVIGQWFPSSCGLHFLGSRVNVTTSIGRFEQISAFYSTAVGHPANVEYVRATAVTLAPYVWNATDSTYGAVTTEGFAFVEGRSVTSNGVLMSNGSGFKANLNSTTVGVKQVQANVSFYIGDVLFKLSAMDDVAVTKLNGLANVQPSGVTLTSKFGLFNWTAATGGVNATQYTVYLQNGTNTSVAMTSSAFAYYNFSAQDLTNAQVTVQATDGYVTMSAQGATFNVSIPFVTVQLYDTYNAAAVNDFCVVANNSYSDCTTGGSLTFEAPYGEDLSIEANASGMYNVTNVTFVDGDKTITMYTRPVLVGTANTTQSYFWNQTDVNVSSQLFANNGSQTQVVFLIDNVVVAQDEPIAGVSVGLHNLTVELSEVVNGVNRTFTTAPFQFAVTKLGTVQVLAPTGVLTTRFDQPIQWSAATDYVGTLSYDVVLYNGTNTTILTQGTENATYNFSAQDVDDMQVFVIASDDYVSTTAAGSLFNITLPLTASIACHEVYPNEDDMPSAALLTMNVSYTTELLGAPSYSIDLQGLAEVCSNGQCNATVNYYTPSGNYTGYANVTVGGKTAEANTTACRVGALLARKRTTNIVTFPTATPGVVDAPGNTPVNIRNTGNVQFGMYMTAYNLSGRVNANVKLPATAFKAGPSLGSAVTLGHNVTSNLSMTLAPGLNVSSNINLWLTMSPSQLVQDYYTPTPWEVTVQG